jgi:hypothetical protein
MGGRANEPTVWFVDGWFGDIEWVEAVHATKAGAEEHARRLWVDRRSEVLPADHHVQGLCKFDVTDHAVLS